MGRQGSETAEGTCESCGRDDEVLTVVRRIWVTPAAWDTEGSVKPGELEAWCATCVVHYPHQEAADD
jgi:hypothetical protein